MIAPRSSTLNVSFGSIASDLSSLADLGADPPEHCDVSHRPVCRLYDESRIICLITISEPELFHQGFTSVQRCQHVFPKVLPRVPQCQVSLVSASCSRGSNSLGLLADERRSYLNDSMLRLLLSNINSLRMSTPTHLRRPTQALSGDHSTSQKIDVVMLGAIMLTNA